MSDCPVCKKDPRQCITDGCKNLATPCPCDEFAMKDRAGRVLYVAGSLHGAEAKP